MHKATKDPEALAKQIADGKYSHKKTLFVDVLLALLAGFFLAQAMPLRDYFMPEEKLGTQGITLETQDEKLALLTDLVEHLDMLVAHPANMKRWPELDLQHHQVEGNEPVSVSKNADTGSPVEDIAIHIGIAYQKLRQYEKALAYFDHALTMNPNSETALYNKAMLHYYDINNKEEGVKIFKKIITLNPQYKMPNGQPLSDLLSELSKATQ